MMSKFCLDNIGFENCLHIKGEVLVTFDNDSIYSDFNEHYHRGLSGKTVTFTMNAPIKTTGAETLTAQTAGTEMNYLLRQQLK